MPHRFFYLILLYPLMLASACATPEQSLHLSSAQHNAATSPKSYVRDISNLPTPRLKPEPIIIDPLEAKKRQERFQSWKRDFTQRAIQAGYAPTLVNALIEPAQINEKALEKDRTQPEFSKPIWSYINVAVSPSRVKNGREKIVSERSNLDAIESRYFVDRYILVAIWGLESAYGKNQGRENIINSMATFAFEGRRQAFGEQQLFGILDALSRGYVRADQLTGSWAGAMGMMQFIPTTFRDYAVDFNGDGNRDIWTSTQDALGSAAHYLSRHGWRAGEPVLAEVKLSADFDYRLSDGRTKSLNDWTALGVAPANGQRWSLEAGFLSARLLVPAGHKGPKFLAFHNFDMIMKYNKSTNYALGISRLSQALAAENLSLNTPWPVSDKPLSLTDKKALQKALTAQGYDTQGVDGRIGPNSRRAIRNWQQDHGYVADGYVEQNQFQAILKSQ